MSMTNFSADTTTDPRAVKKSFEFNSISGITYECEFMMYGSKVSDITLYNKFNDVYCEVLPRHPLYNIFAFQDFMQGDITFEITFNTAYDSKNSYGKADYNKPTYHFVAREYTAQFRKGGEI